MVFTDKYRHISYFTFILVLFAVPQMVHAQESDDDRLQNPLTRAYEDLLNNSDLDDDEAVDDLRKMIYDADKLLSKIKAENREALRNVNRQTPLSSLPNILVILADDLSPEQLGCYGAETSATPVLDQLANRSVVFENFHAGSPIDDDAFWTLWTGRTSNHIVARDDQDMRPLLNTHRSTLLSNLWYAGYSTGFFGGWPLAGPAVPWKAETDIFIGWNDPKMMSEVSPTKIMLNGVEQNLKKDSKSSFAWTMTTMQALAALEREQSGRPFAYVLRYHALDIPDSVVKGETLAERTAAAFDRELGRVIDRLKTKPYANNTLIWVIGETADAGILHDANSKQVGNSLQSSALRVPSILFILGVHRPCRAHDCRLALISTPLWQPSLVIDVLCVLRMVNRC